MRGNPKDDLFRADRVLTDCQDVGGWDDEGWCCRGHIDALDAKWLLELVTELLGQVPA